MLRITVHSSPAAAAAYFFGGGHDSLAEEKAASWMGALAGRLGVSGEVTRDQFQLLADGRNPLTGESLLEIRRGTRRAGTDLTWSAPKAVTLAYELTADTRVVEGFRAAVDATMRDIEAEVQARVRAGGVQDVRTTGNAAWATFVHHTGRPVNGVADPQLHAHSFLFSVTEDHAEGGKFKAAELGDVRKDAPYWESVMLSRLSKSMSEMGYAVKRDGKYFSLAGLDKPLLDKFSRRTQLIEQAAKDRGVTNPDWKSELGGKTRERKAAGLGMTELREEWVSRLTVADKQQLSSLLDQHAELPTVAQSVAHALSHCFERSSINAPRKVYETALRFGYGSATVEAVQQECAAQGLIVKGGLSTTKQALARERRLISYARASKNSLPAIGHVPDAGHLTPGQQAAVRHVLQSNDAMTLVQGQAGTGKTTLLKSIAGGIQAAGLRPLAVAISTAATQELEAVTANTATVARLLADEKMQRSFDVLIVDEASLVGTRQMEALTMLAKRIVLVGDTAQHSLVLAGSPFKAVQVHAGLPVARVSEIVRQAGDYRLAAQHLAAGEIDAGLDKLNEMGWVHESTREERLEAIAADYVWAATNGLTVQAVAPTHAECAAVNDAVRAKLQSAGLVGKEQREIATLTPASLTDAEKADAVGLAERQGLVAVFHRNKGAFKAGDRVQVTPANAEAVAKASSAAAMYRAGTLTLAKGDRVRVTANSKSRDGHRLVNGAAYEVAGFKGGDVELSNGWRVDGAFLAAGYCGTSHASQGKTFDAVLVSMPSESLAAVGSDTAYVALTRGKRFGHLYCDSLPELREAAKRDRTNSNATDLVTLQPENRVRSRATFVARVAQVAAKVAEQVRQLTHKKERDYGVER